MTFSIRATHNGRHHWLAQGDKINLEFDDGKGVSGRIGDVNVEPGGSSFSIIVTHDGQPLVRDGLSGLGMAMSDIMEAYNARPETACDEAQDTDGSNDPTEGERDLLHVLRLKSQAAEDLGHKVEALIRENARLSRDRIVIQDTLDSRTRQLERSRRYHDEKNEKFAELEQTLKRRNRDVEELRASLKNLGNDYQLVRQQRDDAQQKLEQAQAKKQMTRVNESGIHAPHYSIGGTINQAFYGEPSTQQVLAFRERPGQRAMTMDVETGDSSVTIRVELQREN